MNREKIKQIVSDAFDIEPAQRDAFIRKACGGDESLLAEALSLLDAASNAEQDGFLPSNSGDHDVATVPQAGRGVQQGDPNAPEQFGRYRVLERIGEGGMGIVYRAEQRVPIRREVVVKVIKLGMDTKLVIARFEAERQALAMMDHPHIAKVYDAGADSKGRPYFVMEYVKGTPIVDYCDRNHLSVRERLELFTQVCQAIQHAHHKGIIHRDIKPTNILVSTQDGKPFAKVIDFGIAKATNQRLTDRTLFTEHVNMIGTPAYMSPEQADGNIDIDTRTDVYSLGVVLYELLTGNTPFDARRLKSAAMNEIARIIREEDPPKPSTRVSTMNFRGNAPPANLGPQEPQGAEHSSTGNSLASLAKSRSATADGYVKSLRGEVDWMVMKALEKDRARRYETPNAIAEDIRRYLNGMAVIAAPPSWQYRTRKFVRKYKTSLVAGGVVTLLLMLGLAGTAIGLVQARRSLVREKEATARESLAREDALLQAYVADIGAAQVAMEGERWPEARQRLQECPPGKRGWEWQYLQAMAAAPEFGFAEPVWRCRLSPDDRLLLCQNNLDFQVLDLKARRRIWSYQTKNVQYTSNSVSFPSMPSFDISADGKMAIESEDSVILFGPGGETQTVLNFGKADSADHFVKFSPKGTCLVVNRGLKTSLISTAESKVITEFASVSQMSWAPNEEVVALAAGGGTVAVYEVRTGKVLRRLGAASLTELSEVASTAAFAPDGNSIAVGSNRGSIWIFDLVAGKLPASLSPATGVGIERLAYSPDGKSILVVDSNRTCGIWDVGSAKSVASITDYAVSNEARFSSDGNSVLDTGSRIIWNWKSGSGRTSVRRPARYCDIRAFSQDGGMFVSVDNARVHIWRSDHPDLQSVIVFNDADAKKRSLLCGSFQGRDLYLTDWYEPAIDTLLVLFDKPAGTAAEDAGVTSADHRWTAMPVGEHSVEVRNNLTSEHVATLANHEGKVRCVAFTRDGSRMVSGSDDCTIRFWDTRTWREIASLRCNSAIAALSFAGDESRLIVGLVDKSIESLDVRDAATRQREADEEYAETKRQSAYVDSLLNGTVPWDNLAETVAGNTSMSPLSRIAALDVMHEQLERADRDAAVTLESLKSTCLLKQQMQQALQGTPLPRARKKAVERLLADWKPDAKELRKATWEILATAGQSPDRYTTAAAAAEQVAAELPEDHATIIELAAARYRCGKYRDAIDLVGKAKAVGKDKNKLGPNGAVVARPSFADLNNDDALLAMAQFSAGMKDEANASLNRSIRGLGVIGDRRVVCEAASLINPATTRPVARPSPAQFDQITSAIDAQQLADLETKVGQTVTVKGVVARAVPTYAAGHLNLFLQPNGSGVLLWVPHDFLSNFEPAYFDGIANSEVVVTGTLTHYTQTGGSWHGDLEIEVDEPSQITFFDRGSTTPPQVALAHAIVPTPHPPPATAPAAPALTEVDANDLQKLIDLEDSDACIHGTVTSARLTAAQNALILNFGSAKKGFVVYVPPNIFAEFDARFDGHPEDALLDRIVIVTGTVVDYQGAPEIKLTRSANLQLVSKPPATAPVTQPTR